MSLSLGDCVVTEINGNTSLHICFGFYDEDLIKYRWCMDFPHTMTPAQVAAALRTFATNLEGDPTD